MYSTPFFSIIIPCLNESQYLPRLLKNLNQQSLKQFEVIVVDAKSEDDTAQIAQNFKSKFSLTVISTDIRNVSYQRNLGSQIAKGKILIFFDADTQIPNDYLNKLKKAFEDKKPHMLTTYINVDSNKTTDQIFPAFINLFFEISRFFGTPSVYGSMMAINKKVFEDIEGFDEKIKYSEDSQLFQKGIDHNYKYTVLTNPKYTFSLRRFRSEGTLDTIYHYMRLYLTTQFKGYITDSNQYLMGGHIHTKQQKNKPEFIKRYDKLINKINKLPQDQLAKIKTFFIQIFN